MGWLLLVVAIACGVGAYVVGWPAWTAYQQREAIDENAERYLAWRGRAAPAGSRSVRGGPTLAERRRFWVAGLLTAAAVALLIAFFVVS